jgi:hypothetical protein
LSVRQKFVRDVATYLGHDAGVGLSGWLIGASRPAVVHGRVNSPRLRQAINTYTDNFMRATELCRIMKEYGSDKGLGRHNYAILYTSLLESERERPLNLFELGIGTKNIRLKSNMGRQGRPGASLYGWRQYLPNALIFAADIDRDILFDADRIKCFYCDQTSAESIAALWGRPELGGIEFDHIIDDGLHEFEANREFLEGSHKRLRPGGLMIVEDILASDRNRWIDYVARWKATDANIAFVELPHAYNFVSNNIACIERL